jgi:DNA topoisomerase-2
MRKKNVAETYQKLTDIEHVLKRPQMYIGSTVAHSGENYLYDGKEITCREVIYNPGFIKLFDEILSNSIDEHRRNSKLNEIKVTVDLDQNEITIWDNGGIPVEKHPVHKEWIPEMIFSNLKAGSNFDDTQDRNVAGTNGVGSTLTNIFSKKFTIKTCDRSNKFEQTFTDNMNKRSRPKVTKGSRGFTEISYVPDLERFNMSKIDEVSLQILFKRCLDAAACNTKLLIYFNIVSNGVKQENKLRFKSFKDYISLYTDESYFYEQSKDWKIGFARSEDGFKNASFVNSVHTKDGGSHVDYITNQLISHLREMIKKKHKVEVKPSDIRNHLYVFIDCMIVNPSFSSQTKEKLITEVKHFKSNHEVTERIAKQVFGSDIIQSVLDWIEKKNAAEERAKLRKLNRSLDKGRVEKLIDAQSKTNRKNCTLGIFEGDSAKSAFRQFRDPQKMGAYPLRGKFINVHELSDSKVIQNQEVKGLMGSIGLKLGEEPKDLRYGKILIYTDADPDGNSISGQLINFFSKYWPELFDMGMVYKVMTPIVVAKKGNQTKNFYTMSEFEKWSNSRSSKSWQTEYKKGLAALEDQEYEEIIKDPVVLRLKYDKLAKRSLEDWFGSDSQPRKDKLSQQ